MPFDQPRFGATEELSEDAQMRSTQSSQRVPSTGSGPAATENYSGGSQPIAIAQNSTRPVVRREQSPSPGPRGTDGKGDTQATQTNTKETGKGWNGAAEVSSGTNAGARKNILAQIIYDKS